MAGPPLLPEIEWFFVEDGRQLGPLSKAELKKRFESCELDPQTLVWSAALPNWVSAQEIPGLVPETPPPLPVSPPPPLPLNPPPLTPEEGGPIPGAGDSSKKFENSAGHEQIRAKLVLTGDPEQEYLLKTEGESIIGRGHQSDVVVKDRTVSSRHAVLRLQKDSFVLTDLKSSNGTFVNGQRISLPTRLDHGDVLHCGKTQFRFHLESFDEGSEEIMDSPALPDIDSGTQLCPQCGGVFGAEFKFCVHCGEEVCPSSG